MDNILHTDGMVLILIVINLFLLMSLNKWMIKIFIDSSHTDEINFCWDAKKWYYFNSTLNVDSQKTNIPQYIT